MIDSGMKAGRTKIFVTAIATVALAIIGISASVAKGAGKSSVAVEELRLPSKEAAAQVKEAWAARFDALKVILAAT